MRTDDNNNPTAFTTDLAHQAGLIFGKDYIEGTEFSVYSTSITAKFFTAKLIGDPITVTIKLIDAVGYYTATGEQRWSYIAIPHFTWNSLRYNQKRDIIGFQYRYEGGTEMIWMFPEYWKP